MVQIEWWKEPDNQVAALENEETHITHLAAREVDGTWEYAIVHWRYTIATLLFTLKDGVAFDGETGRPIAKP